LRLRRSEVALSEVSNEKRQALNAAIERVLKVLAAASSACPPRF
jgi:hypothetical protein